MDVNKVPGIKMRSKPSLVKEEKIQELAAKIDETDEMKLKMLEKLEKAGLEPPEPEDALYPSELNAHLIDQLKVMTCENNELRKCVFERDEELKEQHKTIAELNNRIRDIISGTGPAISSKSAGVISAKITELCKQNRHLVSEVESYKTKNAGLERKIMQLELLVKAADKLEPCICKDEPIEPDSDELKELNNKLAVVTKKLYESKNKNLELKNDILVATKILQQELGDKFTNIKELINSTCKGPELAGWRGRAQEITTLKAKIVELEEKLNGKPKDIIRKEYSHTQVIRDLEGKRKKEIEQAMKDYDILKQENQELRRKLDGAKCRIRNLECDATTIRQKMQTFVEKSNHDDMLINEQRNEIKNLELYYQEILKENTAKMNRMNSDIMEYQKQNKNTDAKIDALRKQATEKAAKIEELRAQLVRYEECSLQSVFFTPMKTATDNEIKKLSELVVTLNERLDNERHKWDELEAANRKLKERKKRLERKMITLEDEIRALKEDMTKRGSRVSKSSIPKDPFGDFNLGSTSVMKRRSSINVVNEKVSDSACVSTESPTENYETTNKEELQYRLELTEERLKIMEDKLKMVEEEKSEDYNHLTEMIKNSKQLFNEALAVLQREKCICTTVE